MAAVTVTLGCTTAPGDPRGRGIGYATPGEAFDALTARTDVVVSTVGGWTVVREPDAKTLWSFTPPDHPAHPSAIKRTVVAQEDTIGIRMSVICSAPRTACDKLVADFRRLNDGIGERLRRPAEPTLSL